jgi:short-subunit dehydrogenase
MDLRNAVVLITGASSGIGAATARRCAAAGATVILVARSSDGIGQIQQQIAARGGRAIALPADVSTDESVHQLASEVSAQAGQVDVLINCAGFGVFDSFAHASFADLDAMMQTNLYGTVRCIKAFLPQMRARQRGQIINLASVAGLLATPNLSFYSATKFALVGMSRALQLELSGSGVHCALVCPHIVRTPFFARADIAKVNKIAYFAPWLDADDVACAIVRTIKWNSNGEIVVPAVARPLLFLANLLPGVARIMMRLLGT